MGKSSHGPVVNWRLRWRMAATVAAALFLTRVELVSAQSSRGNNTLVRRYRSQYKVANDEFFLRNLNTTLSSLRRQLANSHVYHAVARTLINGESVYGLALCREYLSTPECVACFDYAVPGLRVCGTVNGGHVIYDECDIRYENNNFYTEANVRGNVGICGNETSSQPGYHEAAEKLLSDLRIAAPRTPSFFAASIRQVTGSNATVYAIAQCNVNLSQSVCAECLRIRSRTLVDCLPNTYGRAIDAGCFMRYSLNPFFGVNETTNILPFLNDGNSRVTRSVIGGVVGGVGFLSLVLAFILWHRLSRNSKRSQDGKSTEATEFLQGPRNYSYYVLKTATNNFSEENKLGGGGFGEVYKGILKGGDVVAIKKTKMTSRRAKSYFGSQLTILSNVHHRHLIRLLGYCSKGRQLFLVLEYMENGSLDRFLFGDKRGSLNWKQRFEIIFGIARGLAYLHEQYHVTIIHRDIKSSNILLDNQLQPKITDFGLLRLLPEDKTHLSTNFIGTHGRIAPEYAVHGHLSEKVDTYSFGVLVLEIISGKRFIGVENESIAQNLLDHAWNLYENSTHLNLIDVKLDPSEYMEEEAKKIIEIALMCTQSSASARPAMSEVVTLLSDKSMEQKPTTRSTNKDSAIKVQVDCSTSTLSSVSNTTSSPY